MPNVQSTESALLSIERAQKLDLLIHLITNLRQSLVISGPKGIGKTTLLEELIKCDKDELPVLNIQGASNISFESFQNQLLQLLIDHIDYPGENQNISTVFPLLEQQNLKVVIIFDDAGKLVPGLINTLIQYASENKCLRIVFSLTPDEIRIKNDSDFSVENCHFIEIPPLTKKQCGLFLKNLSAQPGTTFSYNHVTDSLVEYVYSETHGIPGQIISKISNGVKSTPTNIESYKWIGFTLVAAVVLTLAGFLLFDKPNQEKNEERENSFQIVQEMESTEKTTSYIKDNEKESTQIKDDFGNVEESKETISRYNEQKEIQVPENIENDKVVVTKEIIPEERTEDINKATNVVDGIKKNSLDKELPFTTSVNKNEHEIKVMVDKNKVIQIEETVVNQSDREKNASIQNGISEINITEKTRKNVIPLKQESNLEKTIKHPINKSEVEAFIKKEKLRINETANKGDRQWILKQPENYYTMQLIVLSSRGAVKGFLTNYPQQLNDLKVFQKRKQGGSQFVVIYGSFKDVATASLKMKSLPPRYRKAWVRSFRGLHEMVKK